MTLAEAWELRGYEKGVRETEERSRRQVAKNLLKTTTNLEYIHQVTGIDIKDIESLMSEVEIV